MNPPPAPKKDPPKKILPSSHYYTTNEENNNLTNENVENVEELSEENLLKMVNETKLYPGNNNNNKNKKNKKPKYSESILNYRPKVPKMKLPPGLMGGRKTLRKRKNRKLTKKR